MSSQFFFARNLAYLGVNYDLLLTNERTRLEGRGVASLLPLAEILPPFLSKKEERLSWSLLAPRRE